MIADHIVGNAAGPGKEFSFGVELIPFAPEDEAGLLEDLFRVGTIGQQRGNVGVDAPLITDEGLGESVLRAGLHRRLLLREEAYGGFAGWKPALREQAAGAASLPI